MRLYHLMAAKSGATTLREKRLKFSRFDDLNDPFELLSAHLGEDDVRRFHKEMKKQVAKRYGLLCFSRTWRSPVMWAHYADKHKGLCLGFDVKEAAPVDYTSRRLLHAIDERQDGTRTVVDLMKIALTTKFAEWQYEKEWRVFHDLVNEAPDAKGNFFQRFGDFIVLREVLIGYRCTLKTRDVADLIGHTTHDVTIKKVRPSFRRFTMVRQRKVKQEVVRGA